MRSARTMASIGWVFIVVVMVALSLGGGSGCEYVSRSAAARTGPIADSRAASAPQASSELPDGNNSANGNSSGRADDRDDGRDDDRNDGRESRGGGDGNGGDSDAEDASDLWIDVDVTKQRVYIMRGNSIVREMTASTGMAGYETPLGIFHIQNRGEWFYSEKYQEGAQWWVSFKDWGIYLFHTVPMDRDMNIIQTEADKLGQPASHGCVRLSVDDAKWIYDNIQKGTKVVIHK